MYIVADVACIEQMTMPQISADISHMKHQLVMLLLQIAFQMVISKHTLNLITVLTQLNVIHNPLNNIENQMNYVTILNYIS